METLLVLHIIGTKEVKSLEHMKEKTGLLGYIGNVLFIKERLK